MKKDKHSLVTATDTDEHRLKLTCMTQIETLKFTICISYQPPTGVISRKNKNENYFHKSIYQAYHYWKQKKQINKFNFINVVISTKAKMKKHFCKIQ